MKQSVEVFQDGVLLRTEQITLPDPSPQQINDDTLRSGVEQALDSLRAYIAAPAPTQAQTVAVVKVLCRVAIRLARLQLGKLDATD